MAKRKNIVPDPSKPFAVYEMLVAGEVHYVGMSRAPWSRRYAHAARIRLALAVDPEFRIVSWHATEKAALRVEDARIRTLKPVGNLQSNPEPVRRRMSKGEKQALKQAQWWAEQTALAEANRVKVEAIMAEIKAATARKRRA